MEINEIIAGGGITLAVVLTLIQITPIKFNPWSWLAQKIGKAINKEVIEKVDKLDEGLAALRKECDEREATACRTRIILFGDEILHDVRRHSKEHFDQILLDITNYENYCDTHQDFRNGIAVATIERIKRVYQKCMDENSFL